MNVKQIIEEYLKANGYDGLCCADKDDGCSCEVRDVMPLACCDGFVDDCEAGYKALCDPMMCSQGGDCDFHISTEKPKEDKQ